MPNSNDLNDIFAEEEARLLAESRAEMAREQAQWNALTEEQKASRLGERRESW